MYNRYINKIHKNIQKINIFKFAELAEDEENFGFKIVFHGPGNRSYFVAAESQESMEGWMKALSCASYDFMKLMVAELQKQLDDIDGAETKFILFTCQKTPIENY